MKRSKKTKGDSKKAKSKMEDTNRDTQRGTINNGKERKMKKKGQKGYK